MPPAERPDEEKAKPRAPYAREVARDLLRAAGITASPVSLGVIIRHVQTIRPLFLVGTHDLPEETSAIFVQPGSGNEYIGYNLDHSYVRKRFSIAHEIGHLMLDHTGENPSENAQWEREANIFAAELLMPKDLLKKDFVQKPNAIPEIAYHYRVSKDAMTHQLLDHRIVKF